MIRPALLNFSMAIALAVSAGCTALPGLAPLLDQPHGQLQPGQLVVEWASNASATQASEVKSRLGLTSLAGEGAPRELLSVPVGEEMAYCRRLQAESGVAVAEPNYVVRTHHVPGSLRPIGRRLLFAPNDKAYGATSPNLSQAALWGLKAIKADQAWDTTQGDTRIKVAVIDTGVDMAHPDLAPNLDTAGAINLLEPGRPVEDDFGHGTHVAGIIAAVGNNQVGGLGVAFKTKVMPIRVLGVDGSGTIYDVAAAIDHAVAKRAKVINMSLGSPDRSEVEARAIKQAQEAGVVVVAAAGNEAAVGNYLEYPACYPGVIAVGAVGPDLKRASFSNFNSHVTLVAPGVDIFSTLPTRFGAEPYGYLSGTSMATPMVAGAAALVLAVHPTWTPAQVEAQLRKSARNMALQDDTPDYSVYYGDGLLDAFQAVQ